MSFNVYQLEQAEKVVSLERRVAELENTVYQQGKALADLQKWRSAIEESVADAAELELVGGGCVKETLYGERFD